MFLLTNFLEIISNTVLLSGYISGNNVFPLPLDEDEEKFYHNDGSFVTYRMW